jgi:hypothetical protein
MTTDTVRIPASFFRQFRNKRIKLTLESEELVSQSDGDFFKEIDELKKIESVDEALDDIIASSMGFKEIDVG